MADVASHTQPRAIPNAGLAVSPPHSLHLPQSVQTLRSANLTLDTMSPVTQNGSFEFDRIIKFGEVLKRTRKTKSWKPIFLVLRPNLLSMYRDRSEAKLRHQINLAELTAVARQKDPKRKEQHVLGLFSPSRNYHLGAHSEKEAQEWVELIRRQARIDEDEEEIHLASPGGTRSAYHGFERSIDARISPLSDDRGGYTSSDAEVLNTVTHALPKARERGNTGHSARWPSGYAEYSGPEHAGSYSDFSDSAGPAARMSALSLAYTDGRPSTSSTQQPAPTQQHSIYGQISASRPSMGARNPSQMSGLGASPQESSNKSGSLGHLPVQSPQQDAERVIYHGWLYLLKSKSGVRQWKKVWMVLRPKALALYKNEEEYTALLVLPFHTVIDVVEIDAISRSKTSCMQVISDERTYRFCALDEEGLARWLGAFKSLLAKRKAAKVEGGGSAVAVQPP
ncbi:hypothetical protein LTR36_002136 [Oleoguttula mirabilis]|uniref:PH domain-containing protein n=1 Tax=Oleoguttula mirabilis TaxID=1507867 RepID=A0AAV9JN78_9PEZI|nr:hypothetical protein LTR36_002136 [Oleoguttula mirabilis]